MEIVHDGGKQSGRNIFEYKLLLPVDLKVNLPLSAHLSNSVVNVCTTYFNDQ
jgi:hypothetical protein